MPGVLKEDAMRILIARDGSIYFGNHRIIAEELPREIQERVQNGAEEKIFLAVDPRTRYGSAEKALDQICIAGIRDVSFLTDQPLPPR
jgi:biopolymer transport protein ExbD